MNLYDVLIKMANAHVKIKGSGYSDLLFFDLKNKTIKNGKTILVKNGNIIPQVIKLSNDTILKLDSDWGLHKEPFYNGVEKRYKMYYLSIPTKRDIYARTNFISKKYEKMSYKEIMSASSCDRTVARYELEWFVMANAVQNEIQWDNEHWFWQSKICPKLILYKEYL